MHLWHHDLSSAGGAAKNFGIVFSLWDYLFGTAFWPRDRTPGRLGYPGVEAMPQGLAGQVLWPLTRRTLPGDATG
jgi:sterol desaturase/sphingolipid hydroxylase (fatty acid hydroxylase superfamily)